MQFLAGELEIAFDGRVHLQSASPGEHGTSHRPSDRETIAGHHDAPSHGSPAEDRNSLPPGGQPAAEFSRDPHCLGRAPQAEPNASVHDQFIAKSEDVTIHAAADGQGAAGEIEVPAHGARDRRFIAEEQQVVVYRSFRRDAARGGFSGDDFERFGGCTEGGHPGNQRRQQERHDAGARTANDT